ncbi:protein DCL homolog, chloroplastic [Humulus lupulus]|uniref:protein DCL homolog, chloroplastic n=1 Tax=Humulus lupulus TaxID=3486 RepID=UPI002B40E2BD|nr:protein DCL homolog, chloroplastic [Humulus lupulus]
MASIAKPPQLANLQIYSFSSHHCLVTLSFPFRSTTSLLHTRLSAIKTGSDGGRSRIERQEVFGPDLLRKPSVSPIRDLSGIPEEAEEEEEENERKRIYEDHEDEEKWVDWEDKILEDTVPLVGFVRMLIHSGRYQSGDRLSPEHEKIVVEKLLPFHPECEKKIGCGIDYITVGYHPDFERSRCLFIVQKDGSLVDFSYWKCIKGLIRKNYPLYADSFILRHFRQRQKRGL